MHTSPSRDRVIVAGAGPVGLTAALALARAGVEVLVLEARDAPDDGERLASASLQPATLDQLAVLGIDRALAALGRKVERLQWRDRTGTIHNQLHMASLAMLTDHPFRLNLDYSRLTAILLSKLARTSARIRFAAEVDNLTDSGTSVRVHAAGDWHSARYLIAADGASSRIRSMVGARPGPAGRPMRLMRLRTPSPLDELLPRLAPLTYVHDEVQPCTVQALPGHWLITLPIPDTTAEGPLTRAQMGALARRAIALGPGHRLKIAHARPHCSASSLLRSYRYGHVLFAGDAAHVLPDLGDDLGLNAGLQDAVDLGRVLAAVMGAAASPAALEDWSQRRSTSLSRHLRALAGTCPNAAPTHDAALDRVRAMNSDRDAGHAWLTRSALLPLQPLTYARSA